MLWCLEWRCYQLKHFRAAAGGTEEQPRVKLGLRASLEVEGEMISRLKGRLGLGVGRSGALVNLFEGESVAKDRPWKPFQSRSEGFLPDRRIDW